MFNRYPGFSFHVVNSASYHRGGSDASSFTFEKLIEKQNVPSESAMDKEIKEVLRKLEALDSSSAQEITPTTSPKYKKRLNRKAHTKSSKNVTKKVKSRQKTRQSLPIKVERVKYKANSKKNEETVDEIVVLKWENRISI